MTAHIDLSAGTAPVDFQKLRRSKARLQEPEARREPPHDDAAEKGVLGCIILSPSECVDACETAFRGNAEVFYDLRHQEIYRAIVEVWRKNRALDLVLIGEWMRRKGNFEMVGGWAYLSGLDERTPSAANLPYYLEIVRDKFMLRQMVRICAESIELAYGSGEAGEIVDALEKDLMSVGAMRTLSGECRSKDAVGEHYARLEAGWAGKGFGLPTGFPELDKIMSGMKGGEMIVLGAAPSLGKTALALCILAAQLVAGRACGMFSLETTRDSLAARMMCAQTGWSIPQTERGFDEGQMQEYSQTGSRIGKWPWYICDDFAMTAAEIRSLGRRWRTQNNVELIVIDYLGLIKAESRKMNATEAMTHNSGELKAMAKELGIPLLVLAQLNRDARRENRRPTAYDLRQSGAIEQDADKVIMLHAPKHLVDGKGVVEVLVEKHKNGPKGRIELLFNGPLFRFEEIRDEMPPL